MIETLDGTKRYLATRKITDNPDVYSSLPEEFVKTISEVHFADGSDSDQLGAEGTYGIDLDEEWAKKFQAASNLVDLLDISKFGMGEHLEHTTSEEIEEMNPYLDDSPDLLDVDVEELLNAPVPGMDGAAEFRDEATRTYRYYKAGGITDQGNEGACTGHCRLNFLTMSPIRSFPNLTFAQRNAKAQEYYNDNKKNDEWPGEDYSGSSVSASCKNMIRDGFIKAAVMTTSFEEMCRWKLYKGPLMLSTPWKEGMYRPDANGFIRPTGRKVGGHAIPDRAITVWRTGIWRNSWNLGYGFQGDGYMSEADYRQLISEGLRAYATVQIA